jgi:hypothetical protein
LTLQFWPDPDVDVRWAAWLARGAEHDRKIRRRFAFVLPIIAAVAVAVAFVSYTR